MPFKDPMKRKEYEKKRQHTPQRIAQRKKYHQGFNGKKTDKKYEKSSHGLASRRHYQLVHRYGSSLDEYNRLFKEQNGRCAICGVHQSELRRSLDLDHNHITKQVRGLLCERHNRAIGFFQDSIEHLKNSVTYLEKYERK